MPEIATACAVLWLWLDGGAGDELLLSESIPPGESPLSSASKKTVIRCPRIQSNKQGLAGYFATAELVEDFPIRRPAGEDLSPLFRVLVLVKPAIINYLELRKRKKSD